MVREVAEGRRAWHVVAAVAVAFALLASSCSGDDGASVPDDLVIPLASDLGGVLGRLPAAPDGAVFVAGTSLDAMSDATGVGRSCASVDEVNDWMGSTFADRNDLAPWAPDMLQGATIGRFQDEYGISLCDVDWIVQSLTNEPPSWLFSADVDADRVEAAIRADPTWGEGTFTIDSSTDVDFYDWGDDIDVQRRTPFRDLGIGGQLAIFTDEADGDDVVAVTRSHGDMIRSIQRGSTIADDPSVAIALPILTATDPIAALLTDDIVRWDELAGDDASPTSKAEADRLGRPPWLLVPYDLLAAAHGTDDDGPFLEVVLVHRSAIDAEANLGKLMLMFREGVSITDEPGRRWSERLIVESVGSRDSVLITRLRPTDGESMSAFTMLLRSLTIGDSLFAAD